MKKILTVVGARPQFVKLAAVSPHLAGVFDEHVVHTGQHYDYQMSKLFFEELALPEPRVNLDVGSGLPGWQLGEMVKGVEAVLVRERPAGLVVYGDTTSTLAGALAAVKQDVPVAHVEAGLRSYNPRMPEEQNRVLTDHVSALLLAPTSTAVANLAGEGITRGVYHTGDVMCDAMRAWRERAAARPSPGGAPRTYLVATVHRAENTNDAARLAAILRGLGAAPLPVVFPVHPRTRRRCAELGLDAALAGGALRPVDPVGYLDMLALMHHSAGVLTDSGGLQKEAYFLGVPCVTLRDETEWVETVTAGWNRLVSPSEEAIAAAARDLSAPGTLARSNLDHEYGTGGAGREIARVLAEAWG